MTEQKYNVTREFMNELNKWRDNNDLDAKSGDICSFVYLNNIQNIPNVVDIWWISPDTPIENNNRLIAIIQWMNGEDVFEVEEQHKFIVRSIETYVGNDYLYFRLVSTGNTSVMSAVTDRFGKTKFNTREEAQEWANSHQVVVEIDAEGNEVE